MVWFWQTRHRTSRICGPYPQIFARVWVSLSASGDPMNRIALILLLALPLTLAAQIYKTTDEHGNIVYTDTPPASGTSTEKIKLNPTNTAPPPPDIYRPAPDDPEQPEQINYTADIVSPANETTIPMGPGNFSVTANVSPAPGHAQASVASPQSSSLSS